MNCVAGSPLPGGARGVVLVAVVLLVLRGPQPASAAPSLNLAEATADVKAIAAAGGQADIVLLGDSLSYDPVYSFRPYFTHRLQAAYGDAGPGFLGLAPERLRFGVGWGGGPLGPADPAPHHGLDGLWLMAAPGVPPPGGGVVEPLWNRMQLHYIAQPGGGRLTLTQVDGSAHIARLDTNAETRQVRTFNHRFPAGTSSAVRYRPDGSGLVTLLGLNLVNDAPGLRVHRAANGGWGVDHFLRRDWSFDQELHALGTDMVMVAIGANDGTVPRDQYVAKLHRLVDRLETTLPDGEIVLVAPYDFGRAHAAMVAGAMQEVAAERDVGFINLYETAGSYVSFLQKGYLRDGLHFSEPGGRYVGNLLGDAFITNGASLAAGVVPEPSAAALALAAGAVALRRRRRQ